MNPTGTGQMTHIACITYADNEGANQTAHIRTFFDRKRIFDTVDYIDI